MREGPESDLVLTENAQPALMAVSLAVVRILEKDGGKPLPAMASHVAGHSLGEYSALAAAGSLSLADAARLLKIRGRAMQAAVTAAFTTITAGGKITAQAALGNITTLNIVGAGSVDLSNVRTALTIGTLNGSGPPASDQS